MFSLVKIRARYLTRHWCGVYCSYLFIPTLLLLSLLSINNDNDDDLNYLPKSKGELIIITQNIDFYYFPKFIKI